jgi:energy-coupling factor transporter ATP-binding protein EcfA2
LGYLVVEGLTMVTRGSEGDDEEGSVAVAVVLVAVPVCVTVGDEPTASCDDELSRKAKSRSTSSIDL